jgi:hypothetical protein
MKKTITIFTLLLSLFASATANAFTASYQVTAQDISNGFITEQVWLSDYAMPDVSISGITYTTNVLLPDHVTAGNPTGFHVSIGRDRTRPFAVVSIPAYVSEGANINQVSGFTLNITERPQTARASARTTDVTTSALASGSWYKIGVTNTGFYKIDYNFIKSLGIDPSTVNPADIRIFGNGGHMLSENNAVPRPSDLIENAILVNSSSSSFSSGDNVIFYGVGTITWSKDSANQRFVHTPNLYSDTAYYFISFDQGAGLRIAPQAGAPTPNQTVSSFNYYDVHERDLVNPGLIGKNWYGEEFSAQAATTSQSFAFNFGTPVASVYCTVAFAYTEDAAGSSLAFSMNGASYGDVSFGGITAPLGPVVMETYTNSATLPCNAATASVQLAFTPSDGSAAGYLDYIEINARRSLVMTADQMSFRDWQSVGAGHIAGYQLQGANGSTTVWDITNPQVPVLMAGTLSGSTYSFSQDASALHEFAAMNSTNLYTPTAGSKVANQNLHGSGQVDCIIVTNPLFLDQANALSEYHHSHDGLRTIVATTTQVYNEFSSGAQDISAIRDFERMFFKRAGSDVSQMPRYMILYGGGSYDYKNRIANNSNFVPVYESSESSNNDNAYSGDDFFGFLEDDNDINNYSIVNILDIAVGRLPARSVDNANVLLNKIMNYNSPATLGPWRTSATFVADKGCVGNNSFDQAGNHMQDAETMAGTVFRSGRNIYNEEKVYVDATPLVSTPAGTRSPNANAVIDDQVYKGTFLINYNGHGNPQVWSAERILTQDDFNNWNNANSLSLMITATCDFGQYDQPQFVSAGEQLVLRNGGAAIAILTTSAAVYASYNVALNQPYLDSQFNRNSSGQWNSIGTAYRAGKNKTLINAVSTGGEGLIINFHKFNLLGDPAVVPDFPQYSIALDSITDGFSSVRADTIKALGSYVLNGSVRDNTGAVLTGFNGLANVSFFDKARTVPVIDGCSESYNIQDNIIYKGRATVTNGLFSVSFIAPKDINYAFGAGKLSMYAQSDVTDGAGVDTGTSVGGFSDHPVISTTPPVVKAYMNDSLFLNGGITGNNSTLFVSLFDQTGINVSGNDVGHDMIAILDDNTEQPYVLNNYYQSLPDTYQKGYVSFPMQGLTDGHHTITVKAWDVNDNVGEGTVDFIVIDSSVVDISSLMNYPNPFTNTTNFVFEHNHPDEQMDVQISIFNVGGALMKTINTSFTPTGSRTNELSWDGTGDNGARLPSGVYVYRLNISTEKGFRSSAYQKLVIVR